MSEKSVTISVDESGNWSIKPSEKINRLAMIGMFEAAKYILLSGKDKEKEEVSE